MSDPYVGAESVARIEAAWPEMIRRIAGGESLKQTLEAFPTIHPYAFLRYRMLRPEKQAECERAQRESVEHDLDSLKTIHEDEIDPHRARVRLDALKWYIAKRNPDKYSDRLDARVRVETVDMTAIIAQARLRAERARLPQPAQLISITKLDDLM